MPILRCALILLFAALLLVQCLLPQAPPSPAASSTSISISDFTAFLSGGREVHEREPIGLAAPLLLLQARVSASNYETDSSWNLQTAQLILSSDGQPPYAVTTVSLRNGRLDTSVAITAGLNEIKLIAMDPSSMAADTAIKRIRSVPNTSNLRFKLFWTDLGAPLNLDLTVYGDSPLDSVCESRPHPMWGQTNQYPFFYGNHEGGYGANEEVKIVNPTQPAYLLRIRAPRLSTQSQIDSLVVTWETEDTTTKKSILLSGSPARDTLLSFSVASLVPVNQVLEPTQMISVTSFYARRDAAGTILADYQPITYLYGLSLNATFDYYDMTDNTRLSLPSATVRTISPDGNPINEIPCEVRKNILFRTVDTLAPGGLNTIKVFASSPASYPDSSALHLAYFPGAPFLTVAIRWSQAQTDFDLKISTLAGDSLTAYTAPPYLHKGGQYLFHTGDNVANFSSQEAITIVNPQDASFTITAANFEDYADTLAMIDTLHVGYYSAAGTLISSRDTANIPILSRQSRSLILLQSLNYGW